MLNWRTKSTIDFDTLFEKYKSYVFKIVINEIGNRMSNEDIEETVSDVFFLLWKNKTKIKDNSKLKSYIGTIAKNTAKNKLRSLKKEFDFKDNIISNGQSNEDSYYIKEQLNIINCVLQSIDSIDKKIFLMFYYENKKIKEIAREEDIKVSTIKTRLHRIRKKLKKELENGGYKK